MKLSKKTWSSPSNTMVNGSKEKQSTEVKFQNVEGDVVGDPSGSNRQGSSAESYAKDLRLRCH